MVPKEVGTISRLRMFRAFLVQGVGGSGFAGLVVFCGDAPPNCGKGVEGCTVRTSVKQYWLARLTLNNLNNSGLPFISS